MEKIKGKCLTKRLASDKILLGIGAKIDKTAILGYLSERKIKNNKLIIGKKAIVRSGTVIYFGCKIGHYLETGHNVVVREENIIGNNLRIWSNSVIDYGCKIGDDVRIHCNCYIAQFSILQDEVELAPGVIVGNDLHPGCPDSKKCLKGPLIKKGVRVGVNCTLLPYITIGEYSLIGAGSVVTKDIPAYSLVYGNPAKVVGSIFELKCKLGIRERPYA